MCDPVSLGVAALAMSVASAAAAADAQAKNADYQNQMNERQRAQTLATAAANNSQVNLQQQQNRDLAAQKIAENNRNATIGIGRSTAIGGASGVEGNSVDALLGDLAGQQTKFNNAVETNYQTTISALENQRANVYADAATTINGLKSPAQPDYISMGLKIGQAGLTYAKDTTTPAPKEL